MNGKDKESFIDRSAAILAVLISVMIIITAVFFIIAKVSSPQKNPNEGKEPSIPVSNDGDNNYPFRQNIGNVFPSYGANNAVVEANKITSENIILVNITDGEILASRLSGDSHIVYPASLTKVMTLIVVFENLKNQDALNEQLTISEAVAKQMSDAGASGAGLKAGETLTVKDLIYAMMLSSDGTASVTLAEYIASSEKEFVKLMNEKAKEMGLLKTNFVNCTGLHDNMHYTTCQDMAAIMTYAVKNTFCLEVMSALKYRTTTNIHTDGITFYNSLLVTRIDEAKAAGITASPSSCEIIAGKTGFTDEGKYCLATYARGNDGKYYVVVSTKAPDKFGYIKDYVYMYNTYVK